MSSPEKDFPESETPFAMDLEPTVMPGFTAPVTDPWPPLSREQVVELHEALVDFRHTMEASKSLRGDDEQAALIWEAATSLDGLLVSLGIGTPPPTKRWSEDQLQQAVEEVQSFQDAQSAADGLLARLGLPRHVLSPGPSLATEIAITSAMEASLATPEARRQEGDWEPSRVRKNCWTCRYNHPPVNNCDLNTRLYVALWVGTTKGWTTDGMPPKDADNCPGWEQKP